MKPLPTANALLTCKNGHELYMRFGDKKYHKSCHICGTKHLKLKRIPSSEE